MTVSSQKIKMYWYVLIHDIDGIIVPKKHKTYQDYLLSYLDKNHTASSDDCLSIGSAYFYRNLPQINQNSYPNYVPLLKLNSRFEPEPLGIPNQGGWGCQRVSLK